MEDRFNRRINYLRISVTDYCNYRCPYCMPKSGCEPKEHGDILNLEEIYYISHVLTELGVDKIRITGGEPLVRKGVIHLIESLAKIESIKDLSMTTNGSLLKESAEKLKRAGLKRVNISLDTLKDDLFHELTGGSLKDVREGLFAALEAGLEVKINVVLLKGINDDEIEELMSLTNKYPVDVRFIEAMPIGPTSEFSKAHFMSIEEIKNRFNMKSLDKEDPSSPADLYKIEGARGRVGFIEPLSNRFCKNCNRLRLSSDGKLITCLHGNYNIDLKSPLRRGEDIRPYINKALNIKPKEHELEKGKENKKSMNSIGG